MLIGYGLNTLNNVYMMPRIDFIIPTLGRPEGLQACLDSIDNLRYPQDLIEIMVVEGEGTVPEKVKHGVGKTSGDYVVYAANDIVFEKDSLYTAVLESLENGKRLVAFDTGVRNEHGYICEHFMIKRNLIPQLENGEIFSTDFKHYCCDDWLWAQCSRLGETYQGTGKVKHNHWSRIGSGVEMDWVNKKALEHVIADRITLANKYNDIGLKLRLPAVTQNLSVLNVGVGSQQSGLAMQLKKFKFAKLTMMDVWKPYLDAVVQADYQSPVEIIQEDIRNITDFTPYDYVLIFDVLEHLPKEEAIEVVKRIPCKLLIFGPLEPSLMNHRHGTDDIEPQSHLSLWTEQDFKDLGLKTHVLKNFHTEEGVSYDAIWAWNT